ncbi:hypothetical protein SELMODRAFT_417638 [Selaginella moellendorffii]|uniref:Uncharacterized protein n=1 Tax=Selaginella moellendorffii TaxID=88036 RepID=D8S336_SELML|nr:hypothetical protein SELMODRAFT_417638 [Selaginella moellendorffii]
MVYSQSKAQLDIQREKRQKRQKKKGGGHSTSKISIHACEHQTQAAFCHPFPPNKLCNVDGITVRHLVVEMQLRILNGVIPYNFKCLEDDLKQQSTSSWRSDPQEQELQDRLEILFEFGKSVLRLLRGKVQYILFCNESMRISEMDKKLQVASGAGATCLSHTSLDGILKKPTILSFRKPRATNARPDFDSSSWRWCLIGTGKWEALGHVYYLVVWSRHITTLARLRQQRASSLCSVPLQLSLSKSQNDTFDDRLSNSTAGSFCFGKQGAARITGFFFQSNVIPCGQRGTSRDSRLVSRALGSCSTERNMLPGVCHRDSSRPSCEPFFNVTCEKGGSLGCWSCEMIQMCTPEAAGCYFHSMDNITYCGF